MNENYRIACSETLEIIKNSQSTIREKIPKSFIEFLKSQSENCEVKIDFNNKNWSELLKEETQGILALLYRDYIVTSSERKRLIKEEKEREINIQKEIEKKYNPNDLFKNENKEVETEKLEENDLSNIETDLEILNTQEIVGVKKFYYKILSFFRKILKK